MNILASGTIVMSGHLVDSIMVMRPAVNRRSAGSTPARPDDRING